MIRIYHVFLIVLQKFMRINFYLKYEKPLFPCFENGYFINIKLRDNIKEIFLLYFNVSFKCLKNNNKCKKIIIFSLFIFLNSKKKKLLSAIYVFIKL